MYTSSSLQQRSRYETRLTNVIESLDPPLSHASLKHGDIFNNYCSTKNNDKSERIKSV